MQGIYIHEQRSDMREVSAKLVEDGKAVGVNIAPIMDGLGVQPGGAMQGAEAIAGAEDEQAALNRGEGQEVQLRFR